MLGLALAMVGGCGLSAIGGLVAWWLEKQLPERPSTPRWAYWNDACFSADEKLMAAGGAGFAVLDLASGKVLGRGTEDVYDVACQSTSVTVLGYKATWSWPSGSRGPVAERHGPLLAAFDDGTRVWATRRSGRAIGGALELDVERGGSTRVIELGPRGFGEVGRAKAMPSPKSFAMWPGGRLRDGRLLLAAGWEPNHVGSSAEPVPWGFFALRADDGSVEPVRAPIVGDSALNLARISKVKASADERTLVLANSNGSSAVVFIHGGPNPLPVRASFSGWDEVSRLAVSPDGSRVAVASAFHGEGQPARIVVLESRHGGQVWSRDVAASVYGLALLSDGSLVWASSAREAARVPIGGGIAWHMQMDAP